ncbi:hypothetical protein N0V90_002019 [Kalmusia sp. IMI 367209]|nr:hypothetical protein N0V90_002019 [Kalmusia sp. IMI 367209]
MREVAMMKLMDAITDKPDWNKKIFNEDILSKWREEARALPDGLVSDNTFHWCIEELKASVKYFESSHFVRTLDADVRCVKSDELISPELGDELRRAIEPLLEVSEIEKDWHPNSNGQVLNLVHPSLYPLVGGKSRILPVAKVGLNNCLDFMGQGTLIEPGEPIPSHSPGHGLSSHFNNDKLCSTNFQWLPSDIQFVGETGMDLKVASHINNLHPERHQDLYKVIEKCIRKSVPLWNDVLVRGWRASGSHRIKINEAMCEPPQQPEWFMEVYEHEDDLTYLIPKIKEYIAQPDNPLYTKRRASDPRWSTLPEDPKEWTADSVYEALEEVYRRTRTIIHPEPGASTSSQVRQPKQTGIHLEEEFRKQGLQVIVKLSSIELTPEKPDYAGGSWHLEGMLNESIVATAIYYYDVHNVTESRIRFSQENEVDSIYHGFRYEQGDHEPIAITFGAEDMWDAAAVQEIGSIATRHGRIISFPNTLRHKVEPFSLADKTRPGHRRYLVLWLVDPEQRIASTADVPPQQLSWADGINIDEENKGHLMSLDEAKAYRLELMKERTALNDAVEENFDTYNLCEH